nr:unnamed protein product [Digitaria exilis]
MASPGGHDYEGLSYRSVVATGGCGGGGGAPFAVVDVAALRERETTSYEKAKGWGEMYFRGNFRRLAMVKGEVDPEQVFWSEQSIPPLFGADAGERQSDEGSGLVSDS